MKPEHALIAAIVLLIVIAIARSSKRKSPPTTAASPPAPALVFPGPHAEHLLEAGGYALPYHMQHFRVADPFGMRHQPRNTLRVIFTIKSPRFVEDSPGAHWALMLRNDTASVNEHHYDKTNPRGPVSTGHGIAVGRWGTGAPDFPQGAPAVYGAVLESFRKGPGEPTLYPATLSPALDDAREWSYVVESTVRDGRKFLRCRIADDTGLLHHDTGEVEDHTAFDPTCGDVSFSAIFYDRDRFGATSRVEVHGLRIDWFGGGDDQAWA